jgi:hypothetical protein
MPYTGYFRISYYWHSRKQPVAAMCMQYELQEILDATNNTKICNEWIPSF